MLLPNNFSAKRITAVVVVFAFFLPECWTKLQFADEAIIFKQQQTPGAIIATITLDEEQPGSSISLKGCTECLEVGPSKPDGSADLLIKTNFSWSSCSAQLTGPAENDMPQLRSCAPTFILRDASSVETDSQTRKIFVNQQPELIFVEEGVTEIDENVITQTTIIKRMTSKDPDPRSTDFHARTVKIESCAQLENNLLCPFQLVSSEFPLTCNITTLSCTWNLGSDADYSLVLVKPLDYESEKVLVVRLSLTDAVRQNSGLQNVVYNSITVRVRDVQDTPPEFISYPAFSSVDELKAAGEIVLFVEAIDGDRGQNPSVIQYTLCQVNESGCSTTPHLAIQKNPTTGKGDVIIVKTFTVDDFPGGYIVIDIKATEVGIVENGESVLQLRILVNDVNDHDAMFFTSIDGNEGALAVTSLQAFVDENANVGTLIEFADGALLRVKDLDRGENAKFSLNLSENDIFEISPMFGQNDVYVTLRVKNNARLDAEILNSTLISILVKGSASPWAVTTLDVTVNVRDVNDNPSIYTPCGTDNGLNLNVNETVFTGNKVSLLDMGYASTNLKDSDRDEENRNVVQFRIKQVDQPNFGVSAEGKLELVGKLDYESSKQHKLTIEMNNIGRNGVIMSSECQINIAVIDVNDEAPTIYNTDTEQSFKISEIHRGPVLDYTLRASDPDATANLTFTLKLDRADGPRGLPARNFDLSKHLSIITVPPTSPSEAWVGNFFVKEPLDRETTEIIEATATVTDLNADMSSPVVQTAQFRIVIIVEDVNDNIPALQFKNKELKDKELITENVQELSLGKINLDFAVTDPDSTPSPAAFHPVLRLLPEEYKDHIVIAEKTEDPNFIRLIIEKQFDYRDIQKLTFQLVVYDANPELDQTALSTTAEIQLIIADKNNLIPKIISPINYNPTGESPKVYEIQETDMASLGPEGFIAQTLLEVKATDEDSDIFLPLEYFLSFAADTPLALKQSIEIKDARSKEISLVRPLDREAAGMDGIFNLQLQVKDNALQPFDQRESAITTFAIKIVDINDNPPVFANLNGYSVTLLEKDNVAGTPLLFVNNQATDKDESEGCGKISYSLVKPDNDVLLPLTIDENTASLTLTAKLTQDLVFRVAAFDGKMAKCGPGHTVEAKMTIKILAQNLLYEIIVTLETDKQEERNKSLATLNVLLKDIADEANYEYVFYSMQELKTKADASQVINFSFLNRTDQSALPKAEVTGLLVARITALKAVGVTSIGTSTLVDGKPDEPFDLNIVAIIVLAGLVLILFITTVVFLMEKRKLTRKLRVYKASEGAGVENSAMEMNFSPYAATGAQKKNPIQEQFGEEVDPKTYGREDSLADKRDNDLDVDEESTDIEETGSRSSGRAGVFQGLEAATAEANRRHIQGQLRNSVSR